jgi:hypothetical protein
LVLYNFKFFRFFNTVKINFVYRNLKLFKVLKSVRRDRKLASVSLKQDTTSRYNKRLCFSKLGKNKNRVATLYRVWLRYMRRKRKLKAIGKYIIYKILNSYFFVFFKLYLLKYIRKFIFGLYVDVNIILMSHVTISAAFISRFIKTKLIQGFPFRNIMKVVLRRLRFLLKKKYIRGFKILLTGRFSRRDRSTYY